ncbi:MAG TPA: hypothetical protein PLW14_13210 [Chlorobiota bacterium]|nr:hypothetical protein [Chlorobiota bacterium]
MSNQFLLSALVVLLVSTSPMIAQFGLDRVKVDRREGTSKGTSVDIDFEKTEKARKTREEAERTSSQSKTASDVSPAAAPPTIDVDWNSQPFRPGVMWSSMLSGDCLRFHSVEGTLTLNEIWMTFLPQKTTDGERIDYTRSSDITNVRIWADAVSQSGEVVGRQYFTAAPLELPIYTLTRDDIHSQTTRLSEGTYELRWYVGGHHVFTFPFNVEKLTSDDPYSPVSQLLFLRGPWEEWGRAGFNSDAGLRLSIYHTVRSMDVINQSVTDKPKDYQYLATLYRDNKAIGWSSMKTSHDLDAPDFENIRSRNGYWQRLEFGIYRSSSLPTMKGVRTNTFLTKEDLSDGSYRLEVQFRDTTEKRNWKDTYAFTVRSGKIVPDPKADRKSHTDPLTFLEQGPKMFYFRKQ